MKVINFMFLVALFISCNSQKQEIDKASSKKADSKKLSPINCYEYSTTADTIILKVIHVGNSITGTLIYSLKEKDKNKGTIQGNMRGNILIADYNFMSEGILSTRKVAFKMEGNSFVEGYGDFQNLDSLNFTTSMKLSEVACQ